MSHRIVQVSLLAFALLLSACVAATDEGTSDDEPAAEAASALSGGPWPWIHAATLRCLDSDFNGNVYNLWWNGGDYQKWTNTESADGDQIVNLATGRCLDSDFNGSVYTLPCNGGLYQRWVVTNPGGYYQVRNAATGRCLDGDGNGAVYTLACNGGDYQRWN